MTFLLIFGHTNVNWVKKIIQNIGYEEKFHAESDPVVRKIHKIYWQLLFMVLLPQLRCLFEKLHTLLVTLGVLMPIRSKKLFKDEE